MENKNLDNAKFRLGELIHDTNDPDLLRELKIVLMDVNAIPNDIAQTIIKYEDYNDREALLATITKLHEQNQRLLSEQEDLKTTINELEKDNHERVGQLLDKIKDLTEIISIAKKFIARVEGGF